jgi:phosphoglycolate phosphatase
MTTLVVFDFDGVLGDSFDAIDVCVNHALAVFELSPADGEEIRSMIGPPVHESFLGLCERRGRADLTAACIDAYRREYAVRSLELTRLTSGMDATLDELSRRGATLAVATSKPLHFARPLIERLGIEHHFAVIEGPDTDETLEPKTVTLARALAQLPAGFAARFMIGDRHHDVEAALANDVTPIGVSWGYGDEEELRGAGAETIIASPMELLDIVSA